jgi:hypothetical protein
MTFSTLPRPFVEELFFADEVDFFDDDDFLVAMFDSPFPAVYLPALQ